MWLGQLQVLLLMMGEVRLHYNVCGVVAAAVTVVGSVGVVEVVVVVVVVVGTARGLRVID